MREGWEYKKIGELCAPKKQILRAAKVYSANDEIQYIDISSIDNICQKMTGVTEYVMSEAPSRAQQCVTNGDIIVSTVRPNLKNIAIVESDDDNLVASSGFCVLRPTSIERNYLFHYITSEKFTEHLNKLTTGANYPAVRDSDVLDSIIPLPPLSTQLAIVSELDKINELIRLKKEQLKDYDNLAQSIFYEMFGDPVENEKGWEVKKLGDVCAKITDGTHKTPTYLETGCVFVSAKNIKNQELTYDDVKYISQEEFDLLDKRCNPRVGDLLICKSGSIGFCAIIKRDIPIALFESLALLKIDISIIDRYFLQHLINCDSIQYKIKGKTKGNSIKHLHLNEMKTLPIPLPSLPLQQIFASRITQIEAQKAEVKRAITDLETLLASRMLYWFD